MLRPSRTYEGEGGCVVGGVEAALGQVEVVAAPEGCVVKGVEERGGSAGAGRGCGPRPGKRGREGCVKRVRWGVRVRQAWLPPSTHRQHHRRCRDAAAASVPGAVPCTRAPRITPVLLRPKRGDDGGEGAGRGWVATIAPTLGPCDGVEDGAAEGEEVSHGLGVKQGTAERGELGQVSGGAVELVGGEGGVGGQMW